MTLSKAYCSAGESPMVVKQYLWGKEGRSLLQPDAYLEGVDLVVISISLIFPTFPSTLVPFSRIRNQFIIRVIIQRYRKVVRDTEPICV